MTECRVYFNHQHLASAARACWPDLTRALWNEKTREERLAQYGSRASHFELVPSPQDAELIMLPLIWNYYQENQRLDWVGQEACRAAEYGSRLVVFNGGDFPTHLPVEQFVLFEPAGYASRRKIGGNDVYAIPAFVDDYLQRYCLDQLALREKCPVPVVGFCGQATGSMVDFVRREMLRLWRKFKFDAGLSYLEPPPYETTWFRKRTLDRLAQHSGLITNYILRTRYRAGYLSSQKDPFHTSRLQFVRNILESDYTVCMRGGGNFSVRFYETLCLGRIPIFVNTDCILPFDDEIDYRQYCVWVEEHEIPYIGEKVQDFHQCLSSARFVELQKACRELWVSKLSINGFFTQFSTSFSFLRTS